MDKNETLITHLNGSTHIHNFTNCQKYSCSCLKRWEYAWTVINPLDCRFQPFISSTSQHFHSMFPCQWARRRGWKLENCSIFGALWIDLGCWCSTNRWRGRYWSACVIRGYWLSPLMIRWATTPRKQALKRTQQTWFLRLLARRWIRHDIGEVKLVGKGRRSESLTRWGSGKHESCFKLRLCLKFWRFNLNR